jgi:signal transduction histidine kinase
MIEGQMYRETLSLKAVAAVSVIVPMLFFAIIAHYHYSKILSHAEEVDRRQAHLLAKHVAQAFETVDLIARRVDDRLRGMSWEAIAASEALQNDLQTMEADHPLAGTILLVDGSGAIRAASTRSPSSFEGLSPDQLTRLNEGGRTIVLGSAGGRITFGVERERETSASEVSDRGAGPAVRNAVVVMVSPRYLADFWRESAPSTGEVDLLSADGVILASYPPSPFDNARSSSALQHAIDAGGHGAVQARSSLDGAERAYVVQKIAESPLLIAYGTSAQGSLHHWYRDLAADGLLGVLTAAAMLTAGFFVWRRVRDEQIAWRCAIAAEVEERVIAEREFLQAQKMEVVGQLAGGMAHDFGNVLAGIAMQLSGLRNHTDDPGKRERTLAAALAGVDRAAKVVRSLLNLARRRSDRSEKVDVKERLYSLEGLLCESLAPRSRVVFDLAPGLWSIEADANSFELAMLNLAVNARDAMVGGGTLRIAVSGARLGGEPAGLVGDFVKIEVTDTGVGMTPEILARAAEPFFTTKPVGEGTGLGLSQVFNFARQAGGTTTIVSAPGQGTTVTIYLPRTRESERPAARVHDDARHPHRETVPFDPQMAK